MTPPRGPAASERLALVAGLLLASALMWPLRGYLTDDTFIHLQVARHLADGHGPVFNVGERVYGSTSPLWVALLAGAMAIGLDGLASARAIGVIATLASILLFFQLLRHTVRTPALRVAATLAWAAHAWMMRWSVSGMETPLAVMLTLAGFVVFTAGEPWGKRAAATGFCWALAALARPEGVVLLLLWGLVLLPGVTTRGGVRRWVAGAAFPLLLVGGWLIAARAYYGTFWPQTLAAKAAGGEGLADHAQILWRELQIVGATDAILVAMLLLALVIGRTRPLRIDPERLLPWAWVLGLPILYAVRGVPVLSRYLLPILPVMAWLAWGAAERAWAGEGRSPAEARRAARVAALVAALIVAENAVIYRTQVFPHVRTFSPALERGLVTWGRWFERNTAPEAVIATPDIGAIGYFSRRRVVDLAGLETPAMIPILERETQEQAVANFDFARFARPEYLIDRAPERGHLMRASRFGSCLTPLGDAAMPNLGVNQPEPVFYTFYRVNWTVFDSLAARR
jgi:arabinofuranosyltransferase